jgi:uncharacterized protein involved in exopolysaccharide biosynthesis
MIETRQSRPIDGQTKVDLRMLALILWSGRWLISGISIAVALIAIFVALMLPDIYKVEVLLAPNEERRSGGLSAIAAQYGGLASLAGINLGDTGTDKTSIGLEILESRQFISWFVASRDILVPLIAATDWNRNTGELAIDPDIYDVMSGRWVRDVRPPKTKSPSSQEAYERFMEILSVGQDKRTGLVSVAIEHYSPLLAKQWVDWLVEDLNRLVRERDVDEAEQAIEYLNKQIAETSLTGLQSVFFSLIEEQIKTIVLSKMSDEYLLETIDPAVVPELKSKPRRALIVIVSTFLGFVFGLSLVLVSTSFRVG